MKCPGQDSRYWKQSAIFDAKCPNCGKTVEFFKDDTTRKCPHCSHRFVNPGMDFGCAAYCPFAEQCIGTLPEEVAVKQQADFLKDRVALEMKQYFKSDFKRIGHATRVARYAERIGKKLGANMAVVLCAAYLHDIGLHEAQQKYNNADQYHEAEGPMIAKSILLKLNAKTALIDEVCDIIAHHHHPKTEESLSFKVVYDADLIANIEDNFKDQAIDHAKIENIIANRFLTEIGKAEARERFSLNNN
ncbi:MAG: HD domain-containing protein [Desulfobacterales bacterium]|nr:HD domain-containing protein [Desulfobacterales bacterium]